MRTRHQRGHIFRKGGSWYLRFYDFDANGVRRQFCRKLVDFCDRYHSKSEVKPLAEEFLKGMNEGRCSPQSTMSIVRYAETFYLPHAKEECRPSTFASYQRLWKSYVVRRLAGAILRDFRTVDAANLLAEIQRERNLGRSTLKHIKSLLSGMFTFAKNQGVLDGVNPIRDATIPSKARRPAQTFATSPDEVLTMLSVLKGNARAAVALVFFAGLRPGEARGAMWEITTATY